MSQWTSRCPAPSTMVARPHQPPSAFTLCLHLSFDTLSTSIAVAPRLGICRGFCATMATFNFPMLQQFLVFADVHTSALDLWDPRLRRIWHMTPSTPADTRTGTSSQAGSSGVGLQRPPHSAMTKSPSFRPTVSVLQQPSGFRVSGPLQSPCQTSRSSSSCQAPQQPPSLRNVDALPCRAFHDEARQPFVLHRCTCASDFVIWLARALHCPDMKMMVGSKRHAMKFFH